MIESVGELCLVAALLACAAALFTAVGAFRFGSDRWMRATGYLVSVIALCFFGAAVMLGVALYRSDFRIEYVANYTERTLPWGYKLAALWAGQQGSLLLWGCLLALMGVVALHGYARLSLAQRAGAAGAMAVVCGFFAVLLLFAANPFVVFSGAAPADGRGLNPQLQDIGMILHPPVLFAGYSSCAIPFAVLVGVLCAGPSDNRWLADVRRWLLIAWIFLTAGIVIGAWWAYVELGWGGYWAWDPVENASLLPWLTTTALLHSIMMQQHRGMFKFWNAALIACTFALCIVGTYLTRGGVIDSVHAFAPSTIGGFFLVFLATVIIASAALIIARRRSLRSEREIEAMISREGAYFLANLILVVMMLTTLIGTIWPIISSAAGSEAVTVKPAFYNRVVAPMGIALVALMAVGPVLAYGQFAAKRIARALAGPALFAMLVAIIASQIGVTNIWAILCIGITMLGTATVVAGFITAVSARRRSTAEPLGLASMRLIDRDHRRYGGQIAHLGVMLLVIGVAASSIFAMEKTFSLSAGQSVTFGEFDITFRELRDRKEPNFQAVEAAVEIRHDGELLTTLTPQIRFYKGWDTEPNTEVAIRSSWRKDIYVSIAGWERGGEVTAIQVRLNPGVLWIWIGGGIMACGAIFCLTPPLLRRTWAAPATEDAADFAVEGVGPEMQPAFKADVDLLEVVP